MIQNYIKIAWRTLVKNRAYSTINIVGLTIGLCACMLVGTVVLDDLSYDQSWSRKNDLYRILMVDASGGSKAKNPIAFTNFGNELKNNFPEVEAAGNVRTLEYSLRKNKTDEMTIPIAAIQADTNVWQMLDIQILKGNPRRYIAGQDNLIISESFRKKYFSAENPIGKTIYSVSVYNDEATPFLITGVMADIPQNTYLRAEALLVTPTATTELSREGWGSLDEQLLLMRPHTDMADFSKKANRWSRNYLTGVSEDKKKHFPAHEFQPITEVYLQSDFSPQRVKGDLGNITTFSIIAGLLLLIACINFINLSTARAIRRLRETGVRKILGAVRGQVAAQFMIETLLFFVLSAIIACCLYAIFIPLLERFIEHDLTFNLLGSIPHFFGFLIAILILSILSASYPAWILSGFNAAHALKNQLGRSTSISSSGVRKVLVVFQFAIGILVLIGMITVWRQVDFMKKQEVGFDATNVLSIPQHSFGSSVSGTALKHEISTLQGVQQVSLSGWIPTVGGASMGKTIPDPENPDKQISVSFIIGDADLPTLLGFHLQQGHLFDEHDRIHRPNLEKGISTAEKKEEHASPAKVLMTSSTARLFGNPKLGYPINSLSVTPIGIIDDFHSVSLRNPIHPTVIQFDDDPSYNAILVKVQSGHEVQVTKSISQLWKKLQPSMLQMDWVSDLIQKQYEKEEKQQQLFTLFSALTLFLAALGIFGLIVHATEQRVKEIGIRKVLGASVGSIVRLFSIGYVQLVGIALIITSPIAWWSMNKWLEDFAYRIDVEWWTFAIAGIISTAIALLTISFQAMKAAIANPVESLRDE